MEFGIVIGGMLFILIVSLLLIGQFYPGTGAEVLDWKPTRSPEQEAQNDIDDVDQMLAAANRRRARKGLPQIGEDDVALQVDRHRADMARRKAEYQAARDPDALTQDVVEALERKNARRARKGLPEMTLEEYRASLDLKDP